MKYCYVEQIKEAEQIWFVVCETDSMNILLEPTKYLKHKTREHCSPNTVKKIAYAISYYLCFLKECGYGIEQVLQMKYANQQEHFVRFLYWLKEGKHSERKKKPNNATCNSYLQEIFGYYEFILLEYENAGDVKVLESRDISYNMKPDEKAASEEIEPVSEETLKERNNWKEIKGTLQLLMRTGILFYAAEHPESLSRQSIPGTNLPSKRVKGSSFDNEQRLLDKMDELSFSSLKGIKSLLSVDISMDGRGTLWTKDRYIISYIEDCFSFYGGSDKKDNALLYEVEYLISGKNSDIDNLKRVANYILLLRFINNYIFTGKDTQMKTHINTMASAITGVMGMPQTMKAVQVLIRMAISYGESLLELHTLFSGGEVPLIKDKTTWNLTLKTMAEQLRNKQIVKKGKKNISYKDYLKLFLLTKGNSRTVCYRMMDIMQENIASKEPGFLMENCLFSYSWKGSLAAGGVKLNFVKQCSY